MEKLILKTERLKLIACNGEILQGLIDENLAKYQIADDWITKGTSEALPTFLAMEKSGDSHLGWGIWLMVLKGTNIIVGGCGFTGNPSRLGAVEIGYSISTEYRRQGYTFEACKALIDWAFSHQEVKAVRAKCENTNVASIRLIGKLGMTYLKTSRKNLLEYTLSNYNNQ